MRKKNLSLTVAIVIAALNILWVSLANPIPVIGVVLGLPLVFILPGYVLTELLLRKHTLDISYILLLTLGLSVSIAIVSGLTLNLLPSGLQPASWVVILGIFTIVCALLALFLRRGAPSPVANGEHAQRRRLPVYGYLLGILSILITVGSIYYSINSAIQQPRPGFTQFWILPAVQPGKSCAVHLGVRSYEKTSVTYRVTVSVNNIQLALLPSMTIAPQKEWDMLVPVLPGAAGSAYVSAQLYRVSQPKSAYRTVDLLVPNLGGNTQGKATCGTQNTSDAPSMLFSAYNGTMHIITTSVVTTASLTKIQEDRNGISGTFSASKGLNGTGTLSGTFKGTYNAAKYFIQFTVYDTGNHAILSFQGTIQASSAIAGTLCSLNQAGQCDKTGNYGLWNIAPTA